MKTTMQNIQLKKHQTRTRKKLLCFPGFQFNKYLRVKLISETLAIGFCEGNRTLEPFDVESLISGFLIKNVLHGFVLQPWSHVACCVVGHFSLTKNNYITFTYYFGHLVLCNCCICYKTAYHMTE